MGMKVAHNISAIGANNYNNKAVVAGKKSMEKLSSGYKINRAGDNASGLAVSEKLRSQTRGLKQATNNANDGISLIQTAEGGLNETHAILQRMRELANQSANGTYQDDTDREAMDLEVQALKSEVDRISSATEYNKIKLLDGSLGGTGNTTNSFGATYGTRTNIAALGGYVNVSSNVSGVKVNFTTGASGVGGENAVFGADGTGATITINLVDGRHYSDDEINSLINNALQAKSLTAGGIADIKFTSDSGGITATAANIGATVGGVRDTSTSSGLNTLVGSTAGGTSMIGYGNEITFTANSYGQASMVQGRAQTIGIVTDADAGKERVEITSGKLGTSGDTLTLHLATGVDYTEEDIHNILAKAGYDIQINIRDDADKASKPESAGNKIVFTVKTTTAVNSTLASGAGVGKEQATGGEGLIFQIGANGTADQRVSLNVKDMSSSGLNISSTNVATRDAASAAIGKIDDAIKSVSMQRAGLGAMQNRLEYTVNNLTTTNENLTAAESQIRDTDMAEEVIENSKNSILQQASQAMLAQANQQPQSVLQLLG